MARAVARFGPLSPQARPALAVVIPARNEEANLPALLDSLRYQLSADDDLVVVDDHSTDATARVAAEHGARVVSALGLPEGWAGKAWARATGAAETGAPVMVFVDADVTLEAGGLDRLITEHARRGGLVSITALPPHSSPLRGAVGVLQPGGADGVRRLHAGG